MGEEEKFDVFQFFVDDSPTHASYERMASGLPGKDAVAKAVSAATSVAARIGTTTRVIIVDSGDFTAWHWVRGKGIIFPVRCANEKCKQMGVVAGEPCGKCGDTNSKPIVL